MTSEEVEKIVVVEVEAATNLDVWMEIFLSKHLIKPVKQKYINSFDESKTFEFWTVLEEREDGYRIAYDEEDKEFVLGMLNDDDVLEYIGHHGTFIEALKGL